MMEKKVVLPGLSAMKLVEAVIAFLGPFDQSLVSTDMNMEMGKGIGRMSGHLRFRPHQRCRVQFFKQNESKECREFNQGIKCRPIKEAVVKSLAVKHL